MQIDTERERMEMSKTNID